MWEPRPTWRPSVCVIGLAILWWVLLGLVLGLALIGPSLFVVWHTILGGGQWNF